MSIPQIPPDGASKRFKASQENALAEKIRLVENATLSHSEKLRKQVEAGDILDVGNQSKFGQMLRSFANEEWKFERIMNEFENNKDPEVYKRMMIQRQAIERLFNWIDRGVEIGKQARQQMAMEEKAKSQK